MENIYLHLSSEFDSSIKINDSFVGEFVFEKQNEINVCIENASEGFTVFVYPIIKSKSSEKLLPYGVVIESFGGGISTSNEYVEIVKFPKGHYKLAFKKYSIFETSSYEVLYSKNFTFGNVKHVAKLYDYGYNVFEIETPNEKKSVQIKNKLKEYEIEKIQNVIYLYGSCDEGEYIAVFCDEGIFDFYAEKIEINGNQIRVMENMVDIEKRGKVRVFDINGSSFKEIEDFMVYVKSFPKKSDNLDIIPIAFLEGISLKDYDSARAYLSKKLSEKLSNEQFSSFFGSFSSPQVIQYYDKKCYATIHGKGKNLVAKLYEFEIDYDRKISDIKEF